MKKISKAEIEFDSTSHIDPMGRVFYRDRRIYRAFYPESSSFYEKLLSSDRMKAFISKGKVVDTEIEPELQLEGFGLVVRHRRIDHPNYCFEWPANMLKDAACLTLELAIDMCKDGIVLQDASPFNVFFEGAKPVFIDLGSFTQATNNYLWAAYQQFCNFFLFPLYIYSSGNSSIPKALLMDCFEGVPSKDVKKSLGFFDKLGMPGYFNRVFIPEMMAKLSGRLRHRSEVDSLYSRFSDKVDISRLRMNLLTRLYKDVRNINLPDPAGDWSGYYENTDEETLALKKTEVQKIVRGLNPKSVLDIGCNRGVFSILAEQAGAKVVALDSDHDCVNELYRISKEETYNITPLVMNVLNPSPGIGWRGVQYAPAQKRLKCDMVFAFALIHHLVFTGGQDFSRIVESIRDFQGKWCVIEYVDKDDPMATLLPRRPTLDYSWYTLENFLNSLSNNYSDVTVVRQLSKTRTLILATI